MRTVLYLVREALGCSAVRAPARASHHNPVGLSRDAVSRSPLHGLDIVLALGVTRQGGCSFGRIRCSLAVDPTRKSLEQRRENPPRAFVPEPELSIESLVRRRHQELGGRQGARVHVAEE
jgi:hypothetical protein